NDAVNSSSIWYVIEWSTPAVTVAGAGGAFFVAGSAGFFPQIGTSTFCGNGDETIAGSFFNNGGNVFLTDCGDDCNGNGLDDTYEITVGLASDCNQNGVPDACEIAATPLLDCNGNGVLDVCEGGTFSDCDGSGVPDECKPDCNGNGIPDPCEILAGLGTDCNGNGVLDACDIADGSASDCDGAGLPDECKTDCDGDGLPDGCELLSDPSLDCDGDGTLDGCAIAADPSLDVNNNGVLDSCEGLSLTGIEVEIVPITGVLRTEVTPLPLSAVCYRIYATFDGPAAQVVGVYGSPEEGPLALQAQQGFYSDPLGGGLASSRPCDPKGAFPELRFDSFVTVGGDCALNSSEFAVGIDFSTFLNGGALQSSNGMVLVTPDEIQGYAGQQGRVLIAQLTSRDGSIPEGQFNLIGFNADGSQFEAYAMTWGGPSLVDCNDNGQQDAFDISTGASLDCNRDGIPDECQTDDPTRDCNMNGLPDWCDIADGTSLDLDFNGVPDECECSGDLNGDSLVNVDDILIVILAWGDVGGSAGDANGDGLVDALDLALVITAFGGCL
ncbi:MAG: dockerin type I domain-containing protein, partial [Phycisphaerales bacterium]